MYIFIVGIIDVLIMVILVFLYVKVLLIVVVCDLLVKDKKGKVELVVEVD